MKLAVTLVVILVSISAFANEPKAPHCKAIVDACKKAGFIGGDWKNGDGLWVHCMNPILGRPATPKAPPLKAGLTVPTIAASDVQACLSENPNIGMTKKK